MKFRRESDALVFARTLGFVLSAGLTSSAWADGACSDPTLTSLTAYGLGTHNTLQMIQPGTSSAATTVTGIDGNLIGIDFRPSDGNPNAVYGVTDTGKLYLINVAQTPYTASLISPITPQFAGGYQALVDFNPTFPQGQAFNNLRVIGSNDQNFAVTGANLAQTVVQTALQYVDGDANVKVDPNITAGAYDNNVAGAATTTFYMIDYDRDTFVTIADRVGGSSNTGGGKLKTLGPLVDAQGVALNIAPTAGLDIYTSPTGFNLGLAISGQDLFCIDIGTVDPDQPVGTQRKVVAQKIPAFSLEIARALRTGGLIDLAFNPFAKPAAAAASTPDLELTATGSSFSGAGRTNVNYIVQIKNLGNSPASEVGLRTTQLGCGRLTGTSLGGCVATPSQGSCTLGGLQSNLLACSLGPIAGGTTATVRVGGSRFTTAAGALTSTFTSFSNPADANGANNSGSVTVTFPDSSELTVP